MVLTNEEKISKASALRQVALDQLKLIETCAAGAKSDLKEVQKFKMS